jgi:acyl carrier protein
VLGVALAGIDVTRPIHDLGIDSLDLAAVASRLYERTGVEIDDGDLISVRTISDLALILEAGSEPATTPAKDVPE